MGIHPSETGPGTAHEEAIQTVLSAAKKTGKAAGKHCFSAEEVTLRIRQGFQFLALASDLRFMSKAAREDFNAIDFTGATADSAAETKGSLY
jgi:2-keto-3-deoxy-L-rhamnonate aldolase RhmA